MCHPIKCIFHLLRPLKTHASIGETFWILISDISDELLRKQIFTITKVIRPLPTIQHTVLSQKHRVDKLIVVSKAIYTPQFFSFNCIELDMVTIDDNLLLMILYYFLFVLRIKFLQVYFDAFYQLKVILHDTQRSINFETLYYSVIFEYLDIKLIKGGDDKVWHTQAVESLDISSMAKLCLIHS